MSLDPYARCPCGSGKKLKFCCADLAGDIEKIHHMITGEQPHAALRHVEQALERLPGRASLLDLQAMLEVSLNELEKAETTVQVFLQAHPHNPSALADQGGGPPATFVALIIVVSYFSWYPFPPLYGFIA